MLKIRSEQLEALSGQARVQTEENLLRYVHGEHADLVRDIDDVELRHRIGAALQAADHHKIATDEARVSLAVLVAFAGVEFLNDPTVQEVLGMAENEAERIEIIVSAFDA